jgi:hypothetical protein
MNPIVVLCIIVAALVWRVVFWRYTTRKGANKSWTLLPDWEVKSFLNTSTFSIGMIWLFTYLVCWGDIRPPHQDRLVLLIIVAMKILMLVASLFYPTIGATLDLRFQIKQMDSY